MFVPFLANHIRRSARFEVRVNAWQWGEQPRGQQYLLPRGGHADMRRQSKNLKPLLQYYSIYFKAAQGKHPSENICKSYTTHLYCILISDCFWMQGRDLRWCNTHLLGQPLYRLVTGDLDLRCIHILQKFFLRFSWFQSQLSVGAWGSSQDVRVQVYDVYDVSLSVRADMQCIEATNCSSLQVQFETWTYRCTTHKWHWHSSLLSQTSVGYLWPFGIPTVWAWF